MLRICDLTDTRVPVALRQERPTFAVWRLSQSCQPHAKFVAGFLDYHGDDPGKAWDAIQEHVPDLLAHCSRELVDYLRRWAKRDGHVNDTSPTTCGEAVASMPPLW
jgi:hypothetical protein